MESSPPISNSEPSVDLSRESKRKRRRTIGLEQHETDQRLGDSDDPSRWRTDSEQRIYASKLVRALTQVRRSSSSPVAAVRETADRVLAVSAKGRTRWSRAILTNRLSLRLSQINRTHKKAKAKATCDNRLKKPAQPVTKRKLPVFKSKVRRLGNLIPGCRKIPFPNLLEETTDYIAALQMQVKAMTVLTDLLAGSNSDRLGSSQS